MRIAPTGESLGAVVSEIDLSDPLAEADFNRILRALGEYGVLRFPGQAIDPAALRALSSRFGSLLAAKNTALSEPGMPDVSILSNVVENGRNIGLPDAGQDWHTDMTYSAVPGFVNVLVALRVPMRDGAPRGATEFTNTQAACADLPETLRRRLEGTTATHDLDKYWEHMRREKGSTRPPLTPAQRAALPPVVHPTLLTHPITGRPVIYVNPGFTTRINELPEAESDAVLAGLFEHILLPKYRYVHRWAVGDVLLWDHLGTWHYAVPDYRPDEHRLMKRCQVLADRIFDPDFQRRHLGLAA